MAQSFFIWKNVDCRTMGCILDGAAPIIRPEERVEHITIPGRSGDLTQLEGENIYNSYIQTLTIKARGAARIREIYRWLRGAGYVTFSGEPDKKQPARIIGAVTLGRHSVNGDWWEGEVQMYCQPLKEKIRAQKVTISTSGDKVINEGDVMSRPLWKITASDTSATLAAGGKSITVTGLTAANVYYIDSDAEEVYNADRSAILTANSTGAFPTLEPGANTVTGSGWSAVEIDRRERFL